MSFSYIAEDAPTSAVVLDGRAMALVKNAEKGLGIAKNILFVKKGFGVVMGNWD